jgi:hypothetical protein
MMELSTSIITWFDQHNNFILLLITLGLAIATYALFRTTRRMAQATFLLAEQAAQKGQSDDRHHRQALSPCISYACTVTYLPRDAEHTSARISLWGAISNVGGGAAIDVRWSLRVLGVKQPIESQFSSVSSGYEGPSRSRECDIADNLGANQYQPAFSLELRYRNIFGDELSTTMSCVGELQPLIMNYDLGVLTESSPIQLNNNPVSSKRNASLGAYRLDV